jgi:hypothetical protein
MSVLLLMLVFSGNTEKTLDALMGKYIHALRQEFEQLQLSFNPSQFVFFQMGLSLALFALGIVTGHVVPLWVDPVQFDGRNSALGQSLVDFVFRFTEGEYTPVDVPQLLRLEEFSALSRQPGNDVHPYILEPLVQSLDQFGGIVEQVGGHVTMGGKEELYVEDRSIPMFADGTFLVPQSASCLQDQGPGFLSNEDGIVQHPGYGAGRDPQFPCHVVHGYTLTLFHFFVVPFPT